MASGYVLPEEASAVQDYQTFPGFPGRFFPGTPLSLQQLGLDDEDAADEMLAELGLPLEKVSMSEEEAEAEIDRGDDFKPSSLGGEELPAEAAPEEAPKALADMTHDELDALAAAHSVEFAAGLNKQEKIDLLTAAGVTG
jgi:hypothetical protein